MISRIPSAFFFGKLPLLKRQYTCDLLLIRKISCAMKKQNQWYHRIAVGWSIIGFQTITLLLISATTNTNLWAISSCLIGSNDYICRDKECSILGWWDHIVCLIPDPFIHSLKYLISCLLLVHSINQHSSI